MKKFKNIAIVKEVESPENPGSLERRVVLIPKDVGKLVAEGRKVFVENDAGEKMGFSDKEYQSYGAIIEPSDKIYKNKDLIIKFKGVSLLSITQMRPYSTLLCMAHFHSYPVRAASLRKHKINVIAMEEILESPESEKDTDILSHIWMSTFLQPHIRNGSVNNLNIYVFQWTERLRGAVRCANTRYPKLLQILQDDKSAEEIGLVDKNSLFFYDAKTLPSNQNTLLAQLKEKGAQIFDLNLFEETQGMQQIRLYRQSHECLLLGNRRIQCLHETGQAGARYGLTLLAKKSPKKVPNIKAIILGCGNVAQGATHELYQQGVRHIKILGRVHTRQEQIQKWLKDADIIVNGADQAEVLRGKNYLITNLHLKTVISDGTIIIDLVGGSKDNRSPIEPVVDCTFLTKPYFIQDNVIISALWGWPMMGMEKETTLSYSSQVANVLIGKERLIDGLNAKAKGLMRALVCGPFEQHSFLPKKKLRLYRENKHETTF